MRLSRVAPGGSVAVDQGLRPGVFVGSSLPGSAVSTWLNRRAEEPIPTTTGLRLWLPSNGTFWQDSARTTPATATDDPVGAWDDASGNGFHMLQATSGARPLLKKALMNGRDGVRFDGIDDALAGSLITASSLHVLTFAVSQRAGNTHGPFIKNGETGWAWGIGGGSGGGAGIGTYDAAGDEFIALKENVLWIDSNITTTTAPTVYAGRWNANSQGVFYKNSTTIGLTHASTNAIQVPNTTTYIGGYATRFFGGDLTELLVYACADATAAIAVVNLVMPWLGRRFGVTIT